MDTMDMRRTGPLPMRLRPRARSVCLALVSIPALASISAFASILAPASVSEAQTTTNSAANLPGQSINFQAQTPREQPLLYGVDVGIGETDNVTLVPTDKVSQTIAITDFDFDLKKQSRRFDASAKGNFSYLDFLQNAYGGQFVGRFDGTANFALLPERVIWVLQDSFGQAQIDPFLAVTPTNQENVNYVSTGPDVALRLGRTFFLDLSGRYARTTYDTSPFNSNRMFGSAALGRALSARSNVSIDASFERVLFDDTVVNTDFNRSSGYGHYELQGARTDLIANLGITKVNQGSESITGPMAKLQVARKLSSASTLTLTVGRDLTDASMGFSSLQSGATGGIVTAPAAVTLTNYTVTYTSIDWEYVRNRTTFGVSGTWEKDSYDALPLQDLTRTNGQFRVERRLMRALSAQLLGSVYRSQYQNTDFAETDVRIGGALTFREGRGLEIRLRYDHTSRAVSGVGSGFHENRAFLTIGYRPRLEQGDSNSPYSAPGA